MNFCLFIIDIQNGFITQDTSHIPQRVKSLLEQNLFEHVIFTKFINTPNSPYVKYLNWHNLISLVEQKIVDEIEPFAQVTFDKTIYTACNEETLNFLNNNNIQKVFICGLDTDSCVLKTAIDLFENNINPYVLEYYSASTGGDQFHQAGLLVLSQMIGINNIVTEPLDKQNLNKYLELV
ncbi:MAG: isochorismatase family cysteine hydrolase [Nostoc sp. DedVER02]|uniref:isochorismatase family cysteine hydrolase n=1 Tax=unclassified Nostoc TaxID=2593658 RepID=UPI002AD33802|nr:MULTISPECIES: isochorismatase family cysteine hydrolase [unclassified Nostoc]MDZ7986122.1 isochorismatase family cysteine hydrolase [Nostoc sp. DedVER02]MDZ8115430.1 isochorismatase family cysteine hydrolase [Nostoc sp. DedVER01b]